jgi:hypothetical protein
MGQANREVGGPTAYHLAALMADPCQGVIQFVGVGNGHGGVGNLPIAGQPLQLGRVGGVEWPQE